jgi:hypothetical protein
MIAKNQVQCSAISLFDAGLAHDSSRYHPRYSGNDQIDPPYPCGITSTLSNWILPAQGSVTLEVAGATNLNDGLGFTLINGTEWRGATAKAVAAGTSLSAMATLLANNINADEVLQTLVQAITSGPSVIINSIARVAVKVMTATGNTGFKTKEWIRLKNPVLIKTFSATKEQRKALIVLINQIVGQLQSQANPIAQQYCAMPDGTWVRYKANNARVHRDYHQASLFCYDFLLDCDYSVTTQDDLWQVLAINNQIVGGVNVQQ